MGKDTLIFPWLDALREETTEISREELSLSYDVLKKLLPFLAKRGIPVTPKNYRLFYDYIIFANPEINKTLNEILEKDIKFNDQVSDSLYAFFYAEEGTTLALQIKTLNKATKDFIKVSDNMSESLKNARYQNDHFHAVLTSTSRKMVDQAPVGEFQGHLKDLLAETEQTLASTNALTGRLKEANKVIATLKKDLKTQTTLTKIDELTRLSNRRHLNLEGPRFILETRENGRPLAAIVFDIDRFKKVNDDWGHNNGDKVLASCADIIKKAARSSDMAVRLGGEEFLLLCSNLDIDAAAKVADRVRQNISVTEIDINNNTPLKVTVSGGVAAYIPGEEMTALIARADAALYQAKAGGRNRICLAKTAHLAPPQAAPNGAPMAVLAKPPPGEIGFPVELPPEKSYKLDELDELDQ